MNNKYLIDLSMSIKFLKGILIKFLDFSFKHLITNLLKTHEE